MNDKLSSHAYRSAASPLATGNMARQRMRVAGRMLGADDVIDYKVENFTRGSKKYDLIIDTIGNHDLSDVRRVMTDQGKVVMVGGPSDEKFLGPLSRSIKATFYSLLVGQDFKFMLAEETHEDLDVLRGMMQSGKLTPVIDRRYTLTETPAAIAYVEAGRARGKVIITVQKPTDDSQASGYLTPHLNQSIGDMVLTFRSSFWRATLQTNRVSSGYGLFEFLIADSRGRQQRVKCVGCRAQPNPTLLHTSTRPLPNGPTGGRRPIAVCTLLQLDFSLADAPKCIGARFSATSHA